MRLETGPRVAGRLYCCVPGRDRPGTPARTLTPLYAVLCLAAFRVNVPRHKPKLCHRGLQVLHGSLLLLFSYSPHSLLGHRVPSRLSRPLPPRLVRALLTAAPLCSAPMPFPHLFLV